MKSADSKTAAAAKPSKTAAAAKPSKAAKAPAPAAVETPDMSAILGAGVHTMFAQQEEGTPTRLALDLIDVIGQVREEFEDEENTIADLAASIKKHGVLQAVIVRPIGDRYRLVAGERRYRASKLAGLTEIPAVVREMDDEKAKEIQFAENVERKNLTQLEEARRIQADLDALGTVEAVLEKHCKSRAWLSKILSLLTLPEQTARLVKENITADVEVINNVRQVEKTAGAEEAGKLVETLKKEKGKASARKTSEDAKNKAKGKPAKPTKAAGKPAGEVATPKDRTAEVPGAVTTTPGEGFAGAKSEEGGDPFADPTDSAKKEDTNPEKETGGGIFPPKFLNAAYFDISEGKRAPRSYWEGLSDEEKDEVQDYLFPFFKAGSETGAPRAAMLGLITGTFSPDGDRAFALAAFLHGMEGAKPFNEVDILGAVKPDKS